MYERLKNLKKYVLKGGKCLGRGAFGSVCEPKEIVYNIQVKLYTIQGANYIFNLQDFIDMFDRFIVFKHMTAPEEVDIEKKNMMYAAKARNNILYTDKYQNTFWYAEINNVSFPIFKRFDGNLFNLLDKRYDVYFTHTLLKNAEADILAFLEDLHANNVYHFDIKPENIMYLDDKYNQFTFAVGDYGLMGKSYTNGRGTPGYQAPLLYTNHRDYVDNNKYYLNQDNLAMIQKNWNSLSYSYNNNIPMSLKGKLIDLYAFGVTFFRLYSELGYHDIANVKLRTYVIQPFSRLLRGGSKYYIHNGKKRVIRKDEKGQYILYQKKKVYL